MVISIKKNTWKAQKFDWRWSGDERNSVIFPKNWIWKNDIWNIQTRNLKNHFSKQRLLNILTMTFPAMFVICKARGKTLKKFLKIRITNLRKINLATLKGTTFLRSVTKKCRKYLRLDHTWSLELRVHPAVDRKRVDQYIFKFVFHFERGDLSKDSRKLLNATKMMEVTYRSEFKHTKQFLRGAENKKKI